ncbi:hypothetical protein [Paenarthrobacter sp. YJN-5]|uniref:hypothetical protein n=1 Tax=Paenarthrobacter sp. YJN-5 TaxID=2735316 RepID=UPI0018783002|nr:hypothetical protein [Paenarthrobacter sp. YJN-5]QOT19748.1 hypothetical protein HMI59_24110 [Paenarthrobacter sp. YJN-5]
METFTDGKLREQWDDTSRTYTAWGDDGEISEARPYTEAENTDADARLTDATAKATTQADLLSKMQTALAGNVEFLNLAAPTQAQSLAQIKALTRQVNAAMRYLTNNLDSTAGT